VEKEDFVRQRYQAAKARASTGTKPSAGVAQDKRAKDVDSPPLPAERSRR
jgi:hypothetical protein